MAVSRALMFDISFLLLCHIAQLYGIDVSIDLLVVNVTNIFTYIF